MSILIHLALFLLSAGVIWFFAGLLIESVNNVAKKLHSSGFTVAFFVLGFLTSISEISVMVNSSLNHTPEVSAGNLVGASFVILLFIIPLLAVGGHGISLKDTLSPKQLGLALVTVFLPALFLLDGSANIKEAVAVLVVYITLLYYIRQTRSGGVPEIVAEVEEDLVKKPKSAGLDFFKIAVGALFIFLAGHMLVETSVFFAEVLSVPASIIGLLILSVGTNLPELVIALRSILKKRKDIAFGDYLGSTLANSAIFGVLVIVNSGFRVEPVEFLFSAGLMFVGFILFYIFAVSKGRLSVKEGDLLLVLYAVFVLIQSINLIRFATDRVA